MNKDNQSKKDCDAFHLKDLRLKEGFLFWGILIYSFGILVPIFFSILNFGTIVCFIGLGFIILSIIYPPILLVRGNDFFSLVFYFYFFWSFIIFFRGLFDVNSFKDLFYYFIEYKFGLIPYMLVPISLVFGSSIIFYKRIFKWIYFFLLLFFIAVILFLVPIILGPFNYLTVFSSIGKVEFIIKVLFLPSTFLLLNFAYHRKINNYLIIIGFFIALFVSVYFARRNLIFSIFLGGFFTFISYVLMLKTLMKKVLLIIFAILVILVPLYYVFALDKDTFKLINDRSKEDLTSTRVDVEEAFLKDFNNKPWDYIIGRGGNGAYTINSELAEVDKNKRRSMETGYLGMILKGGLIYLFFHLLIMFTSIFRGLFFSNNIFSKASALFILITIFELGPAGMNRATLYSFITWFLVGLLNCSKIRKMNNETILYFFSSKSKFG